MEEVVTMLPNMSIGCDITHFFAGSPAFSFIRRPDDFRERRWQF
jgi:hypothetical protein